MTRSTLIGLVLVAGGLAAALWLGTRDSATPAPSAAPTAAAPAAAEAPPAAEAPAAVDPAAAAQARMVRLHQAVAGAKDLAAINAEEARVAAIRKSVLAPLRDGWRARDAEALRRVAAPEASGLAWASGARALVREREGVRELRWTPGASDDATGEASRYLAAFREVVDARFDLRDATPTEAGRTVTVDYELRGVTTAGARRHDRGELLVDVVPDGAAWRVTAMRAGALESLETAAGRAPVFEDATARLALDTVPSVSRAEAIRRGGYALAVADYDDDLRPDVLIGHYGPMQLLRNGPDGFVDVTRQAGLAADTLVKSAAFADLDNDGHKDLALLRFVPPTVEEEGGDLLIYRNKGDGTFAKASDVVTMTRAYDRAMPLAIADFDGNGFVDLYVGFPGSRDFTNDLSRGGRAEGVAEHGLWLNRGDWSFEEFTEASRLLADGSERYPHSTLVTDLEQDGHPDLIVIDDSEQMSPIYKNDGQARFRLANGDTGIDANGFGMAAAAADVDGDGFMDLALTRIDLPDARRIARQWREQAATPEQAAELADWPVALPGNSLYRNRGDGTFEDITEKAGVRWAGAGPAGVTFVDYNGDGWQDLYVANGLWTGGDQEMSSLFARLRLIQRVSEEVRATVANVVDSNLEDPNPMLGLLRNFRGSLEDPAAGPVSDRPTLSFGGPERNRLFRNNGDGTFTEVGFLENADRVEDGYVAAAADFDQDGRQDLLLRHCDPAPGVTFPTVTLLRNANGQGRTLTVFLEGTESNRDGLGTMLTASVGGRTLVREVQATAGAVQGEPSAVFGLGDAEGVDKLHVRWPSGRVETFGAVASGRVKLREGKGMTELAAALP